VFGVCFVSETAQVELKSGRVQAPAIIPPPYMLLIPPIIGIPPMLPIILPIIGMPIPPKPMELSMPGVMNVPSIPPVC